MEIKEAIKKKCLVESKIKDLLNEFSTETGLYLTQINIDVIKNDLFCQDGSDGLVYVNVKLDVKI
ncbi:MAG: hypothetical protein WC143_05280 [Eubacteriales bacterium]|jgi:hypothetical protein